MFSVQNVKEVIFLSTPIVKLKDPNRMNLDDAIGIINYKTNTLFHSFNGFIRQMKPIGELNTYNFAHTNYEKYSPMDLSHLFILQNYKRIFDENFKEFIIDTPDLKYIDLCVTIKPDFNESIYNNWLYNTEHVIPTKKIKRNDLTQTFLNEPIICNTHIKEIKYTENLNTDENLIENFINPFSSVESFEEYIDDGSFDDLKMDVNVIEKDLIPLIKSQINNPFDLLLNGFIKIHNTQNRQTHIKFPFLSITSIDMKLIYNSIIKGLDYYDNYTNPASPLNMPLFLTDFNSLALLLLQFYQFYDALEENKNEFRELFVTFSNKLYDLLIFRVLNNLPNYSLVNINDIKGLTLKNDKQIIEFKSLDYDNKHEKLEKEIFEERILEIKDLDIIKTSNIKNVLQSMQNDDVNRENLFNNINLLNNDDDKKQIKKIHFDREEIDQDVLTKALNTINVFYNR